ncbi:peptidyl-prolyl cis-trans isomerase [Neobacillus ginsengisoli]|uniref:peptidylprolyl isomerase n=1 Tax=Neobacillus ginsengisoli TaxID=904295 RepID=A0ABT9Y2U7_9BACI|nr:peptidyl-prolyl cis-trans isomerase [Neobacillus ginsengisoli]MDQ0202147.1 foldase protein PrsA [Neobacillus ginsengisoli]
MRRKQLWLIIVALSMLNCLTVAFFLSKENKVSGAGGGEETVATVGKSTISRQDWLNELADRYGKDVLKEMIDQKVIKEMAVKYNIKVSDQDVEREFRMLQTNYNSSTQNKSADEKNWKEQIRNSLLLEELLTKDVDISDKELKSYYDKNKEQFNVPTAYHLAQIIVKTNEEATKAIKELSQGSSFSAMAMERSVDEFSANEGGDIGYISGDDDRYPSEYINTAKTLKDGAYSDPIKVDKGYAVLKLVGKMNGKKYSFDEVKEQIRRQIALEQMKTPESASTFWDEAKVDWFYGNKEAQK